MSSCTNGISLAIADFQELVLAVRIDQHPCSLHQSSVMAAQAAIAVGLTEADLGQKVLAILLRKLGGMRLPFLSRRLLALLLPSCCG